MASLTTPVQIANLDYFSTLHDYLQTKLQCHKPVTSGDISDRRILQYDLTTIQKKIIDVSNICSQLASTTLNTSDTLPPKRLWADLENLTRPMLNGHFNFYYL